jgi:hypothetical protein
MDSFIQLAAELCVFLFWGGVLSYKFFVKGESLRLKKNNLMITH